MKILITYEQLNSYKSRDQVPLECKLCHGIFTRTKNEVKRGIEGKRLNDYCSRKCWNDSRKTLVVCANCNKQFYKLPNQIKKTNNNFCSKSCAGLYNSKRKIHGCRRSKLELHLESLIQQNYPELKCYYNDRSVINSELDFYFPTLKLAIELNGIFHYEPIYGQDKLERIQNNDKQKSIQCHAHNIEFCVIDVSSCGHLTQFQKDKYWNIIDNLIKQVYPRHLNQN